MELPLHMLPLCCHSLTAGYFHHIVVLSGLVKLPKPKLGNLRVKGKPPKPLHHCEPLQGWADITAWPVSLPAFDPQTLRSEDQISHSNHLAAELTSATA
jgi:hypothetical protein